MTSILSRPQCVNIVFSTQKSHIQQPPKYDDTSLEKVTLNQFALDLILHIYTETETQAAIYIRHQLEEE